MANKIDGGQDSSSGLGSLADAAGDLLGIGDDDAAVGQSGEDAPKATQSTASDGDDDSWEVEDAVGEAWQDFKGTAGEAVDDLASMAGQAVGGPGPSVGQIEAGAEQLSAAAVTEVLDAADDLSDGVGTLPDRLVDGGQQMYRQVQQQQADLAGRVDEIAQSHPQAAVREAVERAVDGTWEVGQDIFDAAAASADQMVDRSADAVVAAATSTGEAIGALGADLNSLDDQVDQAVEDVADDVIRAGAEAVVDNADLLDEVAQVVDDSLNNEVVNLAAEIAPVTPMGLAFSATRTAGLGLAKAAKAAPGVAQQLADHPEVLRELVVPPGADDIADDLQALEVGDSFKDETGLELSVHAGGGGLVGAAVASSVVRADADTYQVTVDASGTVGGGVGEEVAGEGANADLSGQLSGKIVVEFSGPDAAHDAACLVAATHGEYGELLTMSQADDATLVAATGAFSDSGQVEAFDFEVGANAGLTGGVQTFDGRRYTGVEASMGLSVGEDTPSVQVGDDLAAAWLQDDSLGNPGLDSLMDQLPDGLVGDLKQVYGPKAGLTLAAEPQVTVGLYTPAGQSGPVRATFNAKVPLKAGRSTITGEVGLTVTDVGALADALGTTGAELSHKLVDGKLSMADLRQSAQRQGVALDRYIESQPPKLTMTKADLTGVDNLLGFTRRRGTVETAVLWEPPDELDFASNLTQAVAADPRRSAAPDDAMQVHQAHLSAHVADRSC